MRCASDSVQRPGTQRSFPRAGPSVSSTRKPEGTVVARGADCLDGLAGSADAAVPGLPRLDDRGRQPLRGDDASHDVGPSPVGRARRTVAHVLRDALDLPPRSRGRDDARGAPRPHGPRDQPQRDAAVGLRPRRRRPGRPGRGAAAAGARPSRNRRRPTGEADMAAALEEVDRRWHDRFGEPAARLARSLAAIDASLPSTTPDSLPIIGPALSNAGRARDVIERTGSASDRRSRSISGACSWHSPLTSIRRHRSRWPSRRTFSVWSTRSRRTIACCRHEGHLPARDRDGAWRGFKAQARRIRWDGRAIEVRPSDRSGRDGPRQVRVDGRGRGGSLDRAARRGPDRCLASALAALVEPLDSGLAPIRIGLAAPPDGWRAASPRPVCSRTLRWCCTRGGFPRRCLRRRRCTST